MIINRKNKLKKMCLESNYCCSGEIYKLLNTKTLEKIINNIPKKRILILNPVNRKKYIKSEENFLIILDRYIGYVRDTYHIKHYELINILEETLKNKYNKVLFENINIHSNIEYFLTEYKKMFLSNIVNNTINYSQMNLGIKCEALIKAYNYLKNKNLNNISDLEKIEKYFVKIINGRKENIYYSFKINTNNNKISFYTNQLNWFYEDY